MDPTPEHHDFGLSSLDEHQLAAAPIRQLQTWLAQAVAAECHEPYAMSLATSTLQGRPSVRIVYLRGLEQNQIQFFTNVHSRKGQELSENPWAGAQLFWPTLERQVRIEGRVQRLPDSQSDAYFAARPQESQWGAWASQQSQIIANRETLTQALDEIKNQYPDDVPRPSHWGGYRLEPEILEFWQGRPGRLHDRLRYRWHADQWIIERLSP